MDYNKLFTTIMIAVLSYNMKGFRNCADYLNDVIYQEQPDIACLQGTWHLENACYHIGNLNDNYYFIELVWTAEAAASQEDHMGVLPFSIKRHWG